MPPRSPAGADCVSGDRVPAELEDCGAARRPSLKGGDPIFRPCGAGPGYGVCGPEGNLWVPRPRRWADIALRVAITLAAGAIGFVLARAVRQGMGW